MGRIWLGLVAATLLAGFAMSASAALRALSAHAPAPASATMPAGYETQAHFPGAALLYAETDTPTEIAAPAAGATGTTALPALPIPAAAAAAIVGSETGVVAAVPFSMARSGSVDRTRALQCLTAAIYYEAASEPDAGQRAVAQVILNRVRHPAFPASVCGVVYQGSEHAGCQFSFACDGAMARIPASGAWARASRVAGAALAGYVYAPVGLATHYHTYAVTPAWNRALVMTDMVGAHLFHRWKGYWGTAAAFHQIYAGGEPEPGPHMPVRPLALPLDVAVATPLSVSTDRAQIQPDHAGTGSYLAPIPAPSPAPTSPARVASDDHLPGASQILDKWKDSGKPL